MSLDDAFLDRPRRLIATTLLVAGVLAVFYAAYQFSDVLFCLFVGVVLATALKPLIAAVQGCGARQPFAVVIIYVATSLVAALTIAFIVPSLVNGLQEIARILPRISQQAHQWLADAGDALWAKVLRELIAGLSFENRPLEPESSLTTMGQTASYLGIAFRGLLTVAMVVLLAFYWSLQGDRTVRWLCLLLPVAKREGARDSLAEIEAKVGAYIRGQGLVCLAMACMAAATYSLLGLPNAISLAAIAGVLEVMPVLGPIVAAIPPLGLSLLTDPSKTPWVLAAAVVMQQIESYLIVPPIMDRSVGVHPMVTLLAITAFGSLFGIAGAILAIPLAAIVQVLLNRYVLTPATTEREPPNGRGPLSVLHYDTQALIADIQQRDKADPAIEQIGHLAEEIEAVVRVLDERLQAVEAAPAWEGNP